MKKKKRMRSSKMIHHPKKKNKNINQTKIRRTSLTEQRRTNILQRTSSLTGSLTIRRRKVNDTKTRDQKNRFTVWDCTVTTPTMTHGNRQDTYHEVRSCRIAGKWNYRFQIISTKPTTSKRYTFHNTFMPGLLGRSWNVKQLPVFSTLEANLCDLTQTRRRNICWCSLPYRLVKVLCTGWPTRQFNRPKTSDQKISYSRRC